MNVVNCGTGYFFTAFLCTNSGVLFTPVPIAMANRLSKYERFDTIFKKRTSKIADHIYILNILTIKLHP